MSPLYKPEGRIKHGYRVLLRPEHANSDSRGYILEHRLVMSEFLGRPLNEDEHIHHIDGDKLNNSLENLQVISRSEHTRIHNKDKDIVRDELGRIHTIRRTNN